MTASKPAAARQTAKPAAADASIAAIERPTAAGVNAPGFGSDVVAETLRALDIPYIAVTPGASYRGLHDSIVNYLGNATPQMLLCVHEESAVAIAHGYAKVTGKAIAAAVHSNVGLQHATMAMFNAWCDRMPVARPRRHRPGRRHEAAARGSIGSTPRAIRARSFAAIPNGTTSRPRPAPRAKRCCAAPGSPTPRRRARSTSISMPRCRRRSLPSRCRRSMPRVTCRRS